MSVQSLDTLADELVRGGLLSEGSGANELLEALQSRGNNTLFQGEEEETESTQGNPWPENFPKATQFTTNARMKAHVDYAAAKAGDRDAAARLVLDIMGGKGQQDKLRALGEKHPGAVVVPVHALERSGENKIPGRIADYIGKATGLEVDDNITQSVKVGATNQGRQYRIDNRAKFDGEVQVGKEYILVDDVITSGATINELRQYIESKGGKVVDVAVLGTGRPFDGVHPAQIALTPQTTLDLETKYGVESLHNILKGLGLYGGNYKALTESEARAILKMEVRAIDAARTRGASERQERSSRVLSENLQEREASGQTLDSSDTSPASSSNTLFQSAYNGSPYRFDKFSLEHIGSGEGAQAFGWGLYFAGKKEISEDYRKKLAKNFTYKHADADGTYILPDMGYASDWEFHPDGNFEPFLLHELDTSEYEIPALNAMLEFFNDKENAKQYIRDDNDLSDDIKNNAINFIEGLEKGEPGQLYEVDIPEDDELLDWDKPLSATLQPYKTSTVSPALTFQEKRTRLLRVPARLILERAKRLRKICVQLSVSSATGSPPYINH